MQKNTRSDNKTAILAAIGVILAIIFACLSQTDLLSRHKSTSESPVTPMTIQIPGWEDGTPTTLCLEVSQTYPEEWFGFFKETLVKLGMEITPRQYTFPFETVIPDIMQRIGIQVVEAGTACDATLVLRVSGRAQSARYGAISKDLCYTSAQVDIYTNFSDGQHEPFEERFAAYPETPGMITSSNCPKQPYKAPFMEKSAEALTKTLVGIWGPDMASLIRRSYDRGTDVEEAMADAAKELLQNPELNATPTEIPPEPTTQPVE